MNFRTFHHVHYVRLRYSQANVFLHQEISKKNQLTSPSPDMVLRAEVLKQLLLVKVQFYKGQMLVTTYTRYNDIVPTNNNPHLQRITIHLEKKNDIRICHDSLYHKSVCLVCECSGKKSQVSATTCIKYETIIMSNSIQ